jgi:hypothetical protein
VTAGEIRIGTHVITTTGQFGVIVNWYKPANPNVESDLIAIRVDANAIIWTPASSLVSQ